MNRLAVGGTWLSEVYGARARRLRLSDLVYVKLRKVWKASRLAQNGRELNLKAAHN